MCRAPPILRRRLMWVAASFTFVGWVECVPAGPSTRTCVARNPSSSQVTRWVARDGRFRPDAGFAALHPSYECIAETHDSLPIRRVARAQMELRKQLSAARHPSLHPPPLGAGPLANRSPSARKRPHPQTTPDAYADWRRPGGGNSAGPAALVSKQRPDCASTQDFRSSSALSA